MDYILALIFPCLAVLSKGKVGAALVLLVLQATLIGWLPATWIAFMIVSDANRNAALQSATRRALRDYR
jgi:uncharacterized membrane protein YqaE (UPF0057 family)